jgi:predicted DNA-binding transcriptional regulator AlpA
LPVPPKDWLSHRELAAWLGITEQTLYWANHARTGPRRHRIGNQLRYSADDIMVWLSTRAVGR